jgi:hypothetical protein
MAPITTEARCSPTCKTWSEIPIQSRAPRLRAPLGPSPPLSHFPAGRDADHRFDLATRVYSCEFNATYAVSSMPDLPPVAAAPPTWLGPRPRRRPRLLRHHGDPIFGRSPRQRRNRGSLATKRSSLRPGARMTLDLYQKHGPTSSAAAIRLSRTGRAGTPSCLRGGRIVSSDGAVPTCLRGCLARREYLRVEVSGRGGSPCLPGGGIYPAVDVGKAWSWIVAENLGEAAPKAIDVD